MSNIELDVLPEEFNLIWNGKKTYINTQAYQVGNVINLREYDPNRKTISKYTGKKVRVKIVSVSSNVAEFLIIGLEEIRVFMYVDSETFKKIEQCDG